MRTLIGLLVVLCLNSSPTAADSSCGSFQASVAPPPLELAPPAGFVEICSRDTALCAKLASGYPPTAKTVGYFVTSQEWDQYREGRLSGFTRYLIAQVSEGTAPSEFPDLKNFIRSQQGVIPDNTELSPVFDAVGRSNIGVFEDSETAISSGVVMKLQPATSGPPADLILASANTAFLTKGRVLSLYAFTDVTAKPSAEPVKQLTREWLKCLRSAK